MKMFSKLDVQKYTNYRMAQLLGSKIQPCSSKIQPNILLLKENEGILLQLCLVSRLHLNKICMKNPAYFLMLCVTMLWLTSFQNSGQNPEVLAAQQ